MSKFLIPKKTKHNAEKSFDTLENISSFSFTNYSALVCSFSFTNYSALVCSFSFTNYSALVCKITFFHFSFIDFSRLKTGPQNILFFFRRLGTFIEATITETKGLFHFIFHLLQRELIYLLLALICSCYLSCFRPRGPA